MPPRPSLLYSLSTLLYIPGHIENKNERERVKERKENNTTHATLEEKTHILTSTRESLGNIDADPTIDDAEHDVQFDKLYSSFQYFETCDDKSEVNQSLLNDLRAKQSSSLCQNLISKRSRY